MANADAQPTLTPAEDNPWYLLATLHGVPGWRDKKRQADNRVAWNRYYASQWTDEDRERLKGRVTAEELTPFDDQELMDIRQKFAGRAKGRPINQPDPAHYVNFNSCCFQDEVFFEHYAFANSDFGSATFAGVTYFNRFTVAGDAYFNSATFAGNAEFICATFAGFAYFESATFAGEANFRSATFREKVIFTNSEMKAPTDFTGCRFEKYPPQFPGAKLHEGTVWRGVSWPRPPLNPDEAGLFTDAYERLKLEMDRLKKHEDELMFFAKELQCRRVAAGWFRGLPIAAYGALCDYGQSYLLPLGWLLALILVGAVQFWPVLEWDFLLSLGVSTANTLGPLGLRKELVDPSALGDLSRWLRFLTGLQMVMGLVLLFLIGLGLRNRFRMK